MKELRCITCPIGCKLTVYENNSPELDVVGNECEKGYDFAVVELTNPTRSLTTTVRTTLPGVAVLPVRTDGEIPKEKIREAMRALSGVVVSRELDCGDVVFEDLAGTGVRVIAASDVLQRRELQYAIRNKQRAGTGSQFGSINAGFVARDPRALDRIGYQLLPEGEDPGSAAAEGETDEVAETPAEEDAALKKATSLRPEKGRAQIRRK